MFSLIITIISIALVAALALATLFYGGTAFTQSAAKAEATRLMNEGQQLLAAADLFKANTGRYPNGIEELRSADYLKTVPLGQAAIAQAVAQAADGWTQPTDGVALFVAPTATSETCKKVNEASYGLDGVLFQLHDEYISQCWGAGVYPTPMDFQVVFAKSSADMLAAQDSGNLLTTVTSDPVPAANEVGLWFLPPGGVAPLAEAGTVTTPPPSEPPAPEPAPPPPPPPPAALTPAVAPSGMALSRTTIDFGEVNYGRTYQQQIIISRLAPTNFRFTSPPAIASGSPNFSIITSDCSGQINNSKQSCTVTVGGNAPTEGTFDGSLTFSTDLTPSTVTVPLRATGVNPVSLNALTIPTFIEGKVGQTFSFRPAVSLRTGATPDWTKASWAITGGSLPTGVTLDARTGAIAGTPPEGTVGNYNFTLELTYDTTWKVSRNYALSVTLTPFRFISMATGGGHTCGVVQGGAVWCWGANDYGQLGDGGAFIRRAPVPVTGISAGAVQVTAGQYFSCALLNTGEVRCWGRNDYGQLGDNTLFTRKTPVTVANLSGVTKVDAGVEHVCAIANGGLKCWGKGGNYRLGDQVSTMPSRSIPTDVVGMTAGVLDVSAGWATTCAVLTGGSVKCWGWNEFGQVGSGSTQANVMIPETVSGISNAVSISAGQRHTCAVLQGGSVSCWGTNGNGELGSGAPLDVVVRTPRLASNLTLPASSVNAGGQYTCAVTTGGIRCWGAGADGRLGIGPNESDSLVPLEPIGLGSQWVAIAQGVYNYTCATRNDGVSKCWGPNSTANIGPNAPGLVADIPVVITPFY